MLPGAILPETTPVNVFVILVATGLIWIGAGWLEDAAEHLATYYGLPPVVQGSVIAAIGSSVPELASVVFAALADVFNMGVGAIVGSAIFNILVIPAVAGLAAETHLESSRTIVYKEAQFYMLAVSALVITFALAVIYRPVPNGPELAGLLTRPLAVIPLLLYALYLFIQWQDVSDYEPETVPGDLAVGREWGKLLLGLLVILLAVEEMVRATESLGGTFGVPEFLLGVTIIAAATSLPDTVVSVRAAREGRGVTSLGNVFGSNTFDLLVVIPVGVLLVGSAAVNFSLAVPMLGILTVATVLVFGFLRTDLSLTTLESYVLLGAYLLFVAWVLAETLGLTAVLQGV